MLSIEVKPLEYFILHSEADFVQGCGKYQKQSYFS